MTAPILIAFSTLSGSTAEVAQAVGEALQAAGLAPEILAMESVSSLQGRSALILGAPLYIGKLPKEFHRFMASHQTALKNLRPWLFVLGPIRADPEDFNAARSQVDRQLGRYAYFHPAEIRIFGGRFDIAHLPPPFSFVSRLPIPAFKTMSVTDIRDWDAIRDWARGIARKIQSAA